MNNQIRQALADCDRHDADDKTFTLGFVDGIQCALIVAERLGIADGEDWKARAEDAERSASTFAQASELRGKDLLEAFNKIAKLEESLRQVFPDVPEEGDEEAA